MQSVLQMVERLQRLFNFFFTASRLMIRTCSGTKKKNHIELNFLSIGRNCVQAKKLLICDSIQYDIY